MRDGQLQHGPRATAARASASIQVGTSAWSACDCCPPGRERASVRTFLRSTTRRRRAACRSTHPSGRPSTPAAPGSLEVVLQPFPATVPNTEVGRSRDGGRAAAARRPSRPMAQCSSPGARSQLPVFATRLPRAPPCACASCCSPTGPVSSMPSAAGPRSSAPAKRCSTPVRPSFPASSRFPSHARPLGSSPTGGSCSSW